MNVLLCLFPAKKRPGSTTGTTTTTPPTGTTTGSSTTGNTKKTRTVGVQHNVVPISLGHGFRSIGGSQDLFDDSQDDDDIQLTQNTPPRPPTPPSNTTPALGNLPSVVPPLSVPPSSGAPPSAPLVAMSGHNNLQVIQDSFKAIQDGLSAISSYIMNTGSQPQVQSGTVPQVPQGQGPSSPSGMHSLSTVPYMTNVPNLQPVPTLQSTSVVNTCATLQAGCSLASGMVLQPGNVAGNVGNVAGTGPGTSIMTGMSTNVSPVQVGTMTTQVITQAGHNAPSQGFVTPGARTGMVAAAGHHANSQGSLPASTASYNVHNPGSAPNSMSMPTLTLTSVVPVSGNFTGISASVTQPLPMHGGATVGPIGGAGGGIGATTVPTASGTAAQGAVEPRQVISMGLPLGHAVDPKIKEMIWQNKFIELHLLVKPESEDDYDVHLNPKEGCFQFRRKKSSISSILTWCDAMQTYQSVMMMDERTAKDVPDFLTYIKDVRGIADEGWDWVFYDDEYRKYRASCEHPQPWSVHRLDFYNQARRKTLAAQKKASFAFNNAARFANPMPMVYGSNQFQQGQVGQFPGPSTSGVPRGFCFSFHLPQMRCTRARCTFRHLCFMCSRGEHAAYNCRNVRPPAYPAPVWPNQFQSGWPNQFTVRQPAGNVQANEHRQQGPRSSAPRQQLSNSFKQPGNANTSQ